MSRLIFFFVNILIIFLSPIILRAGIFSYTGDIFYHYYPLRYFAQLQLSNGHFPFWNPYVFAGMPFQANIQTALFYPLNLIFYFLPLKTSFNFTVFIHLFLGGVFIYLLGKTIKFKNFFSFLAILGLCFSAYVLGQTTIGHLTIFSGYFWFPLILLLVFRIRKNLFFLIIFSLACSLQIFSGHPQAFFLSLFSLALFLIFYRHRIKNILFGLAIAFCIVALQLLPSMELESCSLRALANGWGYNLAASYSLPFKNLINLIFPDFWGSPLKGAKMLFSEYFELHCLYLGIIFFIFYFFSLFEKKRGWEKYFCSLNLFALLFSFGLFTPYYYLSYLFLPGIEKLRVPGRFFYLFLFTVIILAISQLQKLISSRRKKKLYYPILFLFVFFELYFFNHKYIYLDRGRAFDSTAVIRYLQKESGNFRLTTLDDLPNPNKTMLYQLENLDGYEATIPQGYIRYLARMNQRPFSNTARGEIINYRSPYLSLLGVKYLVTTQKMDLPVVFSDGDLKIYENRKALGKFSLWPDFSPETISNLKELPWTDRLTVFSPNKFVLDTFSLYSGNLLIADAYFPGWQIFIDGKKQPKEKIFDFLNAVFLASGRHKIYSIYNPVSWKIGFYLSISVLTILALFGIFTLTFSTPLRAGSFPLPSRERGG